MTMIKRFPPLAAIIVICLGATTYGKPIEMLKHGDFEKVEAGAPAGWKKGNAGVIGVAGNAFQGKGAANFKAVPHEWGFSYFGTTQNAFDLVFTRPGIPVVPGATYNLSIMAMGTGDIGFLMPMSSTTDFLGSACSPEWPLTYEWRQYTFKLKVDNPRIRSVLFGVKLSGLHAEADIDSASMTFDPVENPGIDPGFNAELAINNVVAAIESRNANASLCVNGKPVPANDGNYRFDLVEGYNAIAIKATAKGTNPGIKLSFPGHPEAEGSWRVGLPEGDAWQTLDFDDGKWAVATADKDGFTWGKDSGMGSVVFRQVILWNKTHYGSNRCVLPQIKEWGFSPDTVETFVLALYAPQNRPFSSYEFVLDLPEGFRLLDITQHQQSDYNKTPSTVAVESIKRDGQDYTRHRLCYPARQLDMGKTQYSLLPVKMEKDFKENTAINFYFHRKINGNITELTQRIPVVVLPPLKGKQPKKIAIQQYVSMQVSGKAELEHMRQVFGQSAKAGVNQALLSSSYCNNNDYSEALRKAYTEADIRLFLWVSGNFPLYGMTLMPNHNPPWLEWMKATPAAQAKYFNNTPDWKSSDLTYFGHMFCPSFVVHDKAGREKFESLLANTYTQLLQATPEAQGIMLDWESHVWQSMDNVPGKGSWCFCDNCKKRFKNFASIPDCEDLSDSGIMEKHHAQWINFRTTLEGELQGLIRDIVRRKLSKRYMVYAQFCNRPFWKACKGTTDLVFSGLPGSAAATSNNQKMLDETMAFYRNECGIAKVIGQRFPYPDMPKIRPDSWKTFTAFSDDGFVRAKNWKSQVLRVVAACHGGIDICNGMSCCGGVLYYLGEATNIISEYEDLFWEGERQDSLAESAQFKYPNLLVLKKGDERLVLLFNETEKPVEAEVLNKNLPHEMAAAIHGETGSVSKPEKIMLIVPPEDVAVIHIKKAKRGFFDFIF